MFPKLSIYHSTIKKNKLKCANQKNKKKLNPHESIQNLSRLYISLMFYHQKSKQIFILFFHSFTANQHK